MSKDHRLVIKIDDADNEWLSEQEEELGIDKVSIVCMMIRRHRRARLPAIQSAPIIEHEVVTRAIDPREYLDLVPYGETAEDLSPHSATEARTEQFVDGEGAEAAIEDLVSARLSEAKITPVVTVNEFGGPTGNVRPLTQNKRPAGKGWAK